MNATEEQNPPIPPLEKGGIGGGSSEPAKPRRRRGVFFWLFMALLSVLAAPVLLYLGVLAFVACGFADRRAAQTISGFFDAPAKTPSVRTEWLRNLKIEKVAIAAPDNTTPLTVDNITLDWDLGPFLSDGRIRTVIIERPRIALRRDAQGQWNIHPNLAAESRYRLEQIIMREGDLSIEWPAPGFFAAGVAAPAKLHLQALSGTLSDQGPLTPRSFSLYGVLDSMESISATGSFGPGRVWNCRVSGGINLEHDLAGVLKPALTAESVKGNVRYDITGWNEVLLPVTQPSPQGGENRGEGFGVAFSSQFIIENLHWPLTAARALEIPNRTLDLSGTARLPSPFRPPQGAKVEVKGPRKLAAFNKLHLRVDGVGSLSGQGALLPLPGLHLALQQGRGLIDGEAVNELFQPRLWGDALTVKGSVAFSDLALTLPFTGNTPPLALRAEFETRGLRAAFPGLGELPPWELKGRLELGPELTGEGIHAVTLKIELQAPAVAGANEARARIKQSYSPREDALKRTGPLEIEEAVWPLAALQQVFDLRRNLGLTGNGTVRLRNTTFDPSTGEARGTIALENVDLVAALPRAVQEAALSALRMSAYGYAAPMFEKSPIEAVSLAGLNARFDARFKDKRLTLKSGRFQPGQLRAELPSLGRTILATLPAAELELELDLPPSPEGRASVLKLRLDDGTKLEAAFQQTPHPTLSPPGRGQGEGPAAAKPGTAWAINGALELPVMGGLSTTFSIAWDLLQRQAGPVTITLKELDLAKAEAWLREAGIERPAGRIKDLELKLEPYSLESLASAKTLEAHAAFEGVQFSSSRLDAGRLTGEAHLRASLDNGRVDVNAILRLRTYDTLRAREAFSVPPGQDGFLRFVGRYKSGEKGPEARLELLQARLGDLKADIKGDPEHVITWAELLDKLKAAFGF